MLAWLRDCEYSLRRTNVANVEGGKKETGNYFAFVLGEKKVLKMHILWNLMTIMITSSLKTGSILSNFPKFDDLSRASACSILSVL